MGTNTDKASRVTVSPIPKRKFATLPGDISFRGPSRLGTEKIPVALGHGFFLLRQLIFADVFGLNVR